MLKIYTASTALPEKEYVFKVIFGEMLKIPYQVIPIDTEVHFRLVLPNGHELFIADQFEIPDQTAVIPEPNNIPGECENPFQQGETIIGIFGSPEFSIESQSITCGLDLFASIFFMLSRWEERVNSARDMHDRFPAAESLAYKAGFLQRPVVNEWVDLIWNMLVKLGWNGTRPTRQYRLLLSCDVDHPKQWWQFSDRFKSLGGALIIRRSIGEALYLIKNQLFTRKDPYDVFDEWQALFEQNRLIVQFNFMGKRPMESDCWYPLHHPYVLNLIRNLSEQGHEIGFHPGYESYNNPALFLEELNSLQSVSPKPVEAGRQHYLRFQIPETWQTWDSVDLKRDSTLGYPEEPGFRCGICHDFPVYDLENRKVLALREQPLIAMDVTLAKYKKYSPEEGAACLHALYLEVKKHRGDFTLLWHNSSWNSYYWEPWKRVFTDFMAKKG
ncbi:MAG: polysaccharide deacetylase family protein [Saprospiraceae bacterium]